MIPSLIFFYTQEKSSMKISFEFITHKNEISLKTFRNQLTSLVKKSTKIKACLLIVL